MRQYRSLLLYAAAVLALLVAYFVSPMSRETVWQLFPGLEEVTKTYPTLTALVFLTSSATFTFLAFPCMPLIYTAAGFYMSGFIGAVTVMLGSVLGGLSAFLFYRKHSSHFSTVFTNQHSPIRFWFALLGLRLSPLVPAPLVNFFAAVCHVSPLQYLTTSVLGSAPLILFYLQIGQQGHRFLSGEPTQWRQFSGYLAILILSTVLSAMGPWKTVLSKLKRLKSHSAEKSAREINGIEPAAFHP